MKLADVHRGIGCTMAGIAYVIMGILGLVIHVWTIVIAFTEKGLIAAVSSLILPVLAQIYWGITIWRTTGTLLNFYCLALIAYVFLIVVLIVDSRLAGSME